MNKNLLILGAGQYGSVIKGIAELMECFEKIDLKELKQVTKIQLADYKFIFPFSEEAKHFSVDFKERFLKLSFVRENELPIVFRADSTKAPSEYNFDEVM